MSKGLCLIFSLLIRLNYHVVLLRLNAWKSLISLSIAVLLRLNSYLGCEPRPLWTKLNVYGACKGNPGLYGGGGLFRSGNGRLKLAFYEYYGYGTSMFAEAKAIQSGLLLAKDLDIVYLWLEIDSLELVKILRGLHSCPWGLYCIVDISACCWVSLYMLHHTHCVKDITG